MEADLGRDPLVRSAELLLAAGAFTAYDVIEQYEATRQRVHAIAKEALHARPLKIAQEVATLARRKPDLIAADTRRGRGG